MAQLLTTTSTASSRYGHAMVPFLILVALTAITTALAAAPASAGINPPANLPPYSGTPLLQASGKADGPSAGTPSKAVATAQLRVLDANTAQVLFKVRDIENMTAAHLHIKPSKAKVVVLLFQGTDVSQYLKPTAAVSSSMLWSTSSFTANDLLGPLQPVSQTGGDLNAFIAAVQAGNVYLNVHTAAYPAGELAGDMVVLQPQPASTGGTGTSSYVANDPAASFSADGSPTSSSSARASNAAGPGHRAITNSVLGALGMIAITVAALVVTIVAV